MERGIPPRNHSLSSQVEREDRLGNRSQLWGWRLRMQETKDNIYSFPLVIPLSFLFIYFFLFVYLSWGSHYLALAGLGLRYVKLAGLKPIAMSLPMLCLLGWGVKARTAMPGLTHVIILKICNVLKHIDSELLRAPLAFFTSLTPPGLRFTLLFSPLMRSNLI